MKNKPTSLFSEPLEKRWKELVRVKADVSCYKIFVNKMFKSGIKGLLGSVESKKYICLTFS